MVLGQASSVKGPSLRGLSLPMSQQQAVAYLEHRVDAARIELRLLVGLRRREKADQKVGLALARSVSMMTPLARSTLALAFLW